MRPPRDLLAVTASITLAAASGATAQEPLRLWSTEADLADFGIDAPSVVLKSMTAIWRRTFWNLFIAVPGCSIC